MDYLCLAVWREVARSESGSREQAQEYFWERFGHGFMAKLETEKKKLEGRIRYYDRKAEKHVGEREVRDECSRRRETAQKELEWVERQLEGGWEQIQNWNYEEKQEFCSEIFDSPVFGEAVLTLRMAKICHIGSDFQVVEEAYSCMMWREADKKGVLEVRRGIPEDVGSCICLDICRERPETVRQFEKKIKRMEAEARRKFR